MKTMKSFAAQQLTKKQMNQVKGGELWDCYLSRPNEKPQLIFLDSSEYETYKAAAEAQNWKLVC